MTSSPTPTPGTHGSQGPHGTHHVLHGADQDPVQSVTDVPSSPGADRADRARRYLTAMGLRGLCFVGAILTSGWLRWTFVAGAVVLPYFAVVLANAVGPGTNGTGRTTVDPRSKQPQALTGTVVDDPLPGERVRDPEHQ